jgi:predicted metalloprotease with PDZ domain
MDASIREGSRGKAGLAELFTLLWARHGENGLTDADVRRAYQELSGKNSRAFWNKYIAGCSELDGAPLQRAFGLKLEAQAPWERLSPEEQDDPAALRRARAWTGLVLAANGPTVQNVLPGSPAATAGLSFGMEILAVDDWRTTTAAEVQRGIAQVGPGGQATVLAADRGRVFEVRLPVEESPERSHRLLPDARASAAQKSAFVASYGQPWPSKPVKRGLRR